MEILNRRYHALSVELLECRKTLSHHVRFPFIVVRILAVTNDVLSVSEHNVTIILPVVVDDNCILVHVVVTTTLASPSVGKAEYLRSILPKVFLEAEVTYTPRFFERHNSAKVLVEVLPGKDLVPLVVLLEPGDSRLLTLDHIPHVLEIGEHGVGEEVEQRHGCEAGSIIAGDGFRGIDLSLLGLCYLPEVVVLDVDGVLHRTFELVEVPEVVDATHSCSEDVEGFEKVD